MAFAPHPVLSPDEPSSDAPAKRLRVRGGRGHPGATIRAGPSPSQRESWGGTDCECFSRPEAFTFRARSCRDRSRMSRSAKDDRRAATLYIHIPTPGDHYSAATGSATMTVIYEISREHARDGGQTRVIVGRGTRHDYPVGVCA